METRIKRFKWSKSYAETSYDLAAVEAGQAIAEELGCNYNEDEHIIYMGEDDLCGFRNWHGSNTYSRAMDGYANGATVAANLVNSANNDFIMNYIKTDNVIAFSFSAGNNPDVGVNIIKQAMVKGRRLSDNSEAWIYLLTGNNNLVFTFAEGSYNIPQKTSGCNAAANSVSLAPAIVEVSDDVIVTDYLYFANWMNLVNQNLAFELDGHEYLAITESNGGSYPKPVIRLT